jgi:hypothetical protein
MHFLGVGSKMGEAKMEKMNTFPLKINGVKRVEKKSQ